MVDKSSERFQEKTEKQRTLTQNRALHKLFTQMAESLNDAGFDMRRTLKETIDIPWTPENVKNFIWRPIQEAQLGKESTTELTTSDIDTVYETINRHLGEKLGVHVAFPSIDTILDKQRELER